MSISERRGAYVNCDPPGRWREAPARMGDGGEVIETRGVIRRDGIGQVLAVR